MTAYIVSVSQPLVFEVEATDEEQAKVATIGYRLRVLAGSKQPCIGIPVIEGVVKK